MKNKYKMLKNSIAETSTTMSDVDQKFWDYFNLDVTPSEATNVTMRDDVTIPAPEGQGFVFCMYR